MSGERAVHRHLDCAHIAKTIPDRLGSRGHLTVVDRRGEILRSYPARMQRAAARALAKRGVEVFLDAAIETVEASGLTFSYGGQTHRCQADLMLWTVGTVAGHLAAGAVARSGTEWANFETTDAIAVVMVIVSL